MEEIFRRLQSDASGHKHKAIRDACASACDVLDSRHGPTNTSQLRWPWSPEALNWDRPPSMDYKGRCQILEVVRSTPSLHEDLQVEVMKVLLCITYSATFDLNGDSILKIAEVCVRTYTSSGHQRSVNTAESEGEDVMTPPQQRKDLSPSNQVLYEDLVTVLTVFCDKLESVDSDNQLLQLLYLESILSMLSSSPSTMHLSRGFTDLIWKQLCPTLVVIMGNPDKTITSHHGHSGAPDPDALRLAQGPGPEGECAGGVLDHGRGSGCSSGAPTRSSAVVRTVCYMAAELVRLLGGVESMKPVLQALFHRLLLYPPPQHRSHILGCPQRVFDLAGPCAVEPDRKRSFTKRKSHLDLLRLVMDGGQGLQPDQARLILRRLDDLKEGAESMQELMEANQRRALSSEQAQWELSERSPDISISITTETGQTTVELEGAELGCATPEEPRLPSPSACGRLDETRQEAQEPPVGGAREVGGRGRRVVPPDVVQRGHALIYPDITNFLSVESRGRGPHGVVSRYKKDSGRSDVSDMGSDSVSLADDEEETPPGGHAHRTLRSAALSLKLLHNQEADQHTARLFVQSLATLMPRLLALSDPSQVDLLLQNSSSSFCAGLQADGLYLVSYYALLLNLKLCCCDHYRQPSPLPPALSQKEFVCEVQASGVVVVLSQVWIEELYQQVLLRNLLGDAGYRNQHTLTLVSMLTDIDGLGSSAIGAQLRNSSQSAFSGDKLSSQSAPGANPTSSDAALAGCMFSRYVLTGVWKNLMEVLSAGLTGHVGVGGRVGVGGQSQRERDTICLSLDGLRKAAALSCSLGVAANCVVGLEMSSHNPDCWTHLLRVSEYISSLEHVHFSDGSSRPCLTPVTQQASPAGLELDFGCEPRVESSEMGLSQPVIQPADRLFEDASSTLKLTSLVSFLQQLRRASQTQLFTSVTNTTDYALAMPGESRCGLDRCVPLHLVRLGEAALRLARDRTRPLLHLMRAWSVVAPHLVEAACHRERHVSQKAVCFLHDLLTEVLTSWAEPPHFHFNEALFRPLQHILQLELCDEDVQDQVVTSLGQLVEACGPNAPVLDVLEAFITTENSQVFANAATDYIMCLIKFIKGLDLCLPALDYLQRCSQLLAKIYKMATKPVFLGARPASQPIRSRDRSFSSDDGMECVLQEFDDQTGLIQVWILLLEQLTAAVSNCPRQHQAPTLQLLFTLLRELTCVPGPGFAVLAVVQLLLPVMSLWLQRSHGDHSYWDAAGGNFKHAIGLSCELVDAFSVTLEPVKKLLLCFKTDGASGDACEVKVAAPSHSASSEAEYWRIRAMEGFEHAQSCVLIIELPADGHTQRRIPFRNIVVSLLSHQVLLQNLYDILLEEVVTHPQGHDRVTPVTCDPAGRPSAGFLHYLSMSNLAVILDLLRDSYKTARDFDSRPGLKYLLMKVSGVCGAANLYRQSAMSFNLYFQTLLCALLSQADGMTPQQVKRMVFEEEEECTSDSSQPGSASSEDEDIFEETAQVSPPRGRVRRPTWSPPRPVPSPSGGAGGPEWAWLVHRLQRLTPLEEAELRGQGAELTSSSPGETTPTPSPGVSSAGLPQCVVSELRGPGGEAGRREGEGRREWWESLGGERSLSRLLQGYKLRRQNPGQQGRLNLFMAAPDRRAPQEQGPSLRHSVSAGPEVLRPERSRSGSTTSCSSSTMRDQQAQTQAWTTMVTTVLNQVLMLCDSSFVALQPIFYPCFSQLTCHALDPRLRSALRDWLLRLGALYDITA
ncbi:hypothetical protein NHX12_023036 [Muraenolepis orangiensis]|uniref:SEC7 domain-containing protein n=1 Tax=Muraenolepis orangiensis TaxID=630683 RepID=A0A9Q0IVP3_9TELE|nr:hypothetical protein NHX12_023036 [Muraenolepis orangiensis]